MYKSLRGQFLFTFLTLLLLIPTEIRAQNEIHLVASELEEGSNFGRSVSIHGNRALIGARNAAYIFEYRNGIWTEVAELRPNEPIEPNFFGKEVSLFGNRALIGISTLNPNTPGSAYIFELQEESWVQVAVLSPGIEGDAFGESVSLYEDRALIGSPEDNNKDQASGSAYIFKLSDGTWQEVQKIQLSPINGSIRDAKFGSDVSLFRNRALIGARKNDILPGKSEGAAYIYELMNDTWVQQAQLVADDAALLDNFGGSVSLSGNRALVSSSVHDSDGIGSGAAYVFELGREGWNQVEKLTASDAEKLDFFGSDVSLYKDIAVIGADGEDENGDFAGAAYVFKRQRNSWTEIAKLTPSDGEQGNAFGTSVSLYENQALFGVPTDQIDGFITGSAYLFNLDPILVSANSNRHNGDIDLSIQSNSPSAFTLHTNHPNPFNPATTIRFELSKQAHAHLAVYDMLGREISVLIDGTLEAGIHETSFEASSLPTGTYLYRLTTPNGAITRTMALLR